MKRYALLVVAALSIVIIASNMTYAQQSIIPLLHNWLAAEPFKALLSKLEFTYWGQTISIETRGYFHFVEFLIRKTTHFLGFGLIGLLFYMLYRKLNWRLPALLAIGTVFVIALLDELHQMAIPGRTGTLEDVRLDTAGAIALVLLAKCITCLWRKK